MFGFVKSTYETTSGAVDCSLVFEGKVKNCFVYYKKFISLSVKSPNPSFTTIQFHIYYRRCQPHFPSVPKLNVNKFPMQTIKVH